MRLQGIYIFNILGNKHVRILCYSVVIPWVAFPYFLFDQSALGANLGDPMIWVPNFCDCLFDHGAARERGVGTRVFITFCAALITFWAAPITLWAAPIKFRIA